MRIFIAQFFPLFLGHYDVAKEDELPNEDCGDSGVFPVKDSNSNSNLSPKLDRINRFLNDVSAIQNAEQANMLQFRYVLTTMYACFRTLAHYVRAISRKNTF